MLLAGANALAQVGIGTTAPKATLDIPATNMAAPTNADGILVPRINAFPAVNPTIDQNGMRVFLTVDLVGKPKGFYYWDNPTNSWIGIGADAKGWELTGNSATNPSVNFMGTTDDKGIIFKRNGVRAGQLSVQNTGFGVNTLNPFNTGTFNTAFGTLTLTAKTTGTQNTAMGDGALQINTTGCYNSAIGSNALYATRVVITIRLLERKHSNSTPMEFTTAHSGFSLRKNTSSYNSGFGVNSLVNNTTGYDNVGVGVNAGYTNQAGFRNVAVGNNALYYNTATGVNALFTNTTGNYNTASGVESLFLNDSGTLNTASGYRALRNNTTGTANTAFGENALAANTTASYSVAIGGSALL